MIIKRVEMSPFGGVSDRKIDFSPGLNIVLGPNEAGKSTLVNSVFSALFLVSGLRKNSAEWKDYLINFLPYPHGDTIQVTLHLTCGQGKDYILTRSWGETRLDRLVLPDGNQVNSGEKVAEMLLPLLKYGKGTYEGVLLARQEEMVRTLEMLQGNREAAHTLSGILRAVVLRSGGVSVEDLGARIQKEKKSLLDLWDMERDGPKGGRGIDNPYKKGLGLLIIAYYQVEGLKKQIKAAQEVEQRVEDLTQKLQQITREKREEVDPQKESMEKIEGDISKRSALEPKRELVIEKGKALKEVSRRWPQCQEQLKNLMEKQEEKEARGKELQRELKESREIISSREKRELYHRIKPLIEQLEKEGKELQMLSPITVKEARVMEEADMKISRLKATLEAMRLKGNFRSQGLMEIKITSGIDEGRILRVDPEADFEARGRVLLETDQWSLEVQSGQQDVEKIIEEVKTAQEFLEEKRREFSLKDLKEARETVEKRGSLENSINQLRIRVEASLKELSYKELEEQVTKCAEDKNVRDPKIIEEEIKKTELELHTIKNQAESLCRQVKEWEEKHQDLDHVLDVLAELRSQVKGIEKEISELAALPESFDTAEKFIKSLQSLRGRSQQINQEIADLRVALNTAQGELPEESAEELREKLKLSQEHLSKLKAAARAICLVEKEYNQMVEETNQQTFDPLVSSLTRYLSPLTNYRYDGAALDGVIPHKISDTDGKELPTQLLSTGTTRGLALALRLAMAEHLLGGSGGFIIMDDPLVDLDPERREQAALVLRDFAQNRQVLITTCDPSTADLLGGTRIQL